MAMRIGRDKVRGTVRLRGLVAAVGGEGAQKLPDVEVKDVKSDSRSVQPGDVFVAVRGVEVDGHRFVGDAVARGAVACVTEREVDTGRAANIVVEDSAKALAVLASEINGNPSAGLRLLGVTGTNGKTSTAHLLRAICERSAWGRVGLIGTVGHGVGTRLEASVHTTPEPLTLHRLFADMKKQECVGVVMEVSSHAVRQQRTWGLDFEIGMLTNVTRDHLDFHPTFDDYLGAKREFCYSLVASSRRKQAGTLVYSVDDERAREIGREFPGRKIATSIATVADVYASALEATLAGTRFVLHLGQRESASIHLQLLGSFSASNAVMAAAAGHALGIGIEGIKAGLESVGRVPGRFDAFGGRTKPLAVVDYSHTPDSLERTLAFCRALGPRRLIVVFGCGGDRDRGKRPLMGEIAQRHADTCYVTSDNPRTEDPTAIIDDILAGMDRKKKGLVVEPDRRKAIHAAIAGAGLGDLVAICGKGHEDYQIVGTKREHFDDREEAERALNAWGAA
jgi:UDP-N-acetylmuramoyl-L-alanyl-D-glutamate--2,6-diaminopimelate ligase